jgi:hypothetical protein
LLWLRDQDSLHEGEAASGHYEISPQKFLTAFADQTKGAKPGSFVALLDKNAQDGGTRALLGTIRESIATESPVDSLAVAVATNEELEAIATEHALT